MDKFRIIFILRNILGSLYNGSRIGFVEATFTMLLKFYLKKRFTQLDCLDNPFETISSIPI